MDTPLVTQPPQATLLDVNTSTYTPDGGVDGNGLVLLTAAGAVVGVATGVAFGLLSQWLYAILIFPVVMGTVVGTAQKYVIKRVKIRNLFASGLAGLLAGLTAVVTIHFVDYEMFKREVAASEVEYEQPSVLALQNGRSAEELKQAILENENDPEVAAVRAVTSFPTYLDWAAKQGVELSSGSASKAINLGYVGTYIYWFADALIIAAVTIYLTREQAAEPFCSACNRWKEEIEVGRLTANAKHIASALKSGQLSGLPNLTFETSHLSSLSVHICGECQSPDEIIVQVKNITYYHGEEKQADAGRYVCDESAIEELSKLFEAPSEAEQPLNEGTKQLLAAADEVCANA